MTANPTTPRPSAGTLVLQTLVPAGVATFVYYKGRPVAAGILFALAAVILISGLLIPALFNRIEKAGKTLGVAFSVALTWVLLVPVFFLVFVPGRLILKVKGLDPLCRQFPTDASTYWVPRKPVTNIEEYKRQY